MQCIVDVRESFVPEMAEPMVDGELSVHSPYFPPFGKLGGTFDGWNSVLNFLERVEELREAWRLSYSDLYRAAVELFSGDALTWFRSMKPVRFYDWPSLVSALKTDFLPRGIDHEILQEIYTRMQKPNERGIFFISAIVHLFNRLSNPPPEAERVRLIIKNMLPVFRPHLTMVDIPSIAKLTEIVVLLEPTLDLVREPLEGKPPNTVFAAGSESQTGPSVPKGVICWNCDGVGHKFRDCKQERRFFCYRCGEGGASARFCQKCSEN